MEQDQKEKIKELLQHFDNIFGTTTSKDLFTYYSKLKILLSIYQSLEEDICKTSPTYNKLRKEHNEVTDLLDQSLSKAQETLFEKHLDIGCEMVSVENEQFFIFGFILGKLLDQNIIIENKEEK